MLMYVYWTHFMYYAHIVSSLVHPNHIKGKRKLIYLGLVERIN